MMMFEVRLIVLVLAGAGTAGTAELPQDFAEMRNAICDSELTKDGCAKCPVYMGENALGALKFDSYVEGSFIAADTDQVLLRSMMSCYSHADGDGSGFLLRKIFGKQKRIAFYHNEMELTGDCRKIRGQEHQKDFLLCE